MATTTLLDKVVNLCKRRGFIFQTAELYKSGLRGNYDYGPLGAELKRNLAAVWWKNMVTQRSDVLPLDTAILTPVDVLRTSGHLTNFTDPLVDCKLSKERFRADKAQPARILDNGEMHIVASSKTVAAKWVKDIQDRHAPKARVEQSAATVKLFVKNISATQIEFEADPNLSSEPVIVPYAGITSPIANSPFLTSSRQFNLMFSTTIGPVDPIEELIDTVLREKDISREQLIKNAREQLQKSIVYLRPETAQGAFSQFKNVVQTINPKLPFGLAQIGKSFRNEIGVEHFIFRTVEFEQMEMQYFCSPSDSFQVFETWRQARMQWWQSLLRNPSSLRFVDHPPDKLAHYSRACTDIEFLYPWGWGELEGIAHRGDYDLEAHGKALKMQMTTRDTDGVHRVPHVVEPAAGLNRGVLAVLLDAYDEQEKNLDDGEITTRTILRLHPSLAPIKAAVLPLVAADESQTAIAKNLTTALQQDGISAKLETIASVGKRYARNDEIGTPFCITIDHQTLIDDTVTLRDRDTTLQRRLSIQAIQPELKIYIQHKTL